MTSEEALERVRKLLALATSPNVHEAAAAAARAQALITQHRLDTWLDAERAAAEGPDAIVDARDRPLETARKVRPWKLVLARALADLNGCASYTLERDGAQHVVLVGRARDRDAVEVLWAWAVKRIEWLSATHGPGRTRRWHEAFRVGAVEAIARRLREGASEAHTRAHGAALATVDRAEAAHRAALDRFVAAHLSLGRGRSLRVDAGAWQKGRRAGDAMEGLPRGPGAGHPDAAGTPSSPRATTIVKRASPSVISPLRRAPV